MYELVHAERDAIRVIFYQNWLEAKQIDCCRFDTRIFIPFKPDQLASMQADLTDFKNNGYQLADAHFVPAQWLFDLIVLTKRYPLAHHRLQFALKENISVEKFASGLAIAFCQEWKQIKEATKDDSA
jgi:hypothetical protein